MVLSPRSDAGVMGLAVSNTFSFPSKLDTLEEPADGNDTDTIPSTDMEDGYHAHANVPKNIKSDSFDDNTDSVEWAAELDRAALSKVDPSSPKSPQNVAKKPPMAPKKKKKSMFGKLGKPFGKKKAVKAELTTITTNETAKAGNLTSETTEPEIFSVRFQKDPVSIQ